ncbi:uncharacterized protein LOC114867396 [Betta splendens]|uniref:Uncharacterized protein LOC114867396 n=1 Tax=Betta splendens TaxID=158456 RepID=A0A6P7P6N2_BETSP|nr:uncharacterized protein LOC114867396 [Betta splendens]
MIIKTGSEANTSEEVAMATSSNDSLRRKRPVSSAASDVSLQSDRSKDDPLNFSKVPPTSLGKMRPASSAASDVSLQSDRSKDDPLNFSKVPPTSLGKMRPVSSAASDVSLQSDRSKDDPLNFSKVPPTSLGKMRPVSSAASDVSLQSDRSKDDPLNFSKVPPTSLGKMRPAPSAASDVSLQSDQSKDDPLSKEPPISQSESCPDFPAASNVSMESDQPIGDPSHSKEPASSDPKNQKSDKPEDYNVNSSRDSEKDAIRKLKEHMKNKLHKDFSKEETETELYEIKINKKDEVVKYNDIFTHSKQTVRTVLTKGVAGIGKTFQVKKFMLDWVNGYSNKNIHLIVSLTFSELDPEKVQSMEELLNSYFNTVQQGLWSSSSKCKLAFILDGLEQCKLPLDFENNKELTDLNEAASMDVLLTNLIKGTLLPSDHIWIISQPSGVDRIPSEFIQKTTECRETLKRRQKLVSDLRTRFLSEYTQVEDPDHPNHENTEHIIREHITDRDNAQTKRQPVKKTVKQVSDIFKDANGKKIRSVLTTGEADIGKTFQMNVFIKQWAESNSSFLGWVKNKVTRQKDGKELIFRLDFSELNLMEENTSLVGLLNDFFEETKKSIISDFAHVGLPSVMSFCFKMS